LIIDLSGRHSTYPFRQACERVEDPGQEDNREVCGEHAAGRHCFDWRRTRLLWDGSGIFSTLFNTSFISFPFIYVRYAWILILSQLLLIYIFHLLIPLQFMCYT